MSQGGKRVLPTPSREEPWAYDVCLSYAGEDRAYVDEVATILRSQGVRVFYDRFEETELWGKDLYEHFVHIYRDAARFCILFISKAYAKKAWPTHERRTAQERALQEHSEYVLPARFDDTEVPGLRGTIAYLDLRTRHRVSWLTTSVGSLDLAPRDSIYLPSGFAP